MAEETKVFQYPEVHVDDCVILYSDPKRGGAKYGKITKCKTQSVDIKCSDAYRGDSFHHDCRHVDDPRAIQFQTELCAPDRGLFEIDPHWFAKQQALEKQPWVIEQIEEIKAEMVEIRKVLGMKAMEVVLPDVAKRGPGRPRKPDVPEVEQLMVS